MFDKKVAKTEESKVKGGNTAAPTQSQEALPTIGGTVGVTG